MGDGTAGGRAANSSLVARHSSLRPEGAGGNVKGIAGEAARAPTEGRNGARLKVAPPRGGWKVRLPSRAGMGDGTAGGRAANSSLVARHSSLRPEGAAASGFREEGEGVEFADAVVVGVGVGVEDEEGLGAMVMDGAEGGEFALEGGGVADGGGDLPVAGGAFLEGDEIDFAALQPADVDFAVAAAEFEENDVFEEVSGIAAAGAEQGGTEAGIDGIVFAEGLEIGLAADVVAVGLAEEVGLAEGTEIFVDGRRGRAHAVGPEGVDNAVDGKGRADVVEGEAHEALEESRILEAAALEDVAVEDGVEDALEVLVDGGGVAAEGEGQREAAFAGIAAPDGLRGEGGGREGGAVFGKGKGIHAALDVAPREIGGQFAGEEGAVGAGDGDVESAARVEAVNQALPSRNPLDFVEQDMGAASGGETGLEGVPGVAPGGVVRFVGIFVVDADDAVRRDAIRAKGLGIQGEGGRFAAASDAGQDFDQIAPLPGLEPGGYAGTGMERGWIVFMRHGETPCLIEVS